MKKSILIASLLFAATSTPSFAEESSGLIGAMVGDSYVGIMGGMKLDKMFSVQARYSKVLVPDINTGVGSIKTNNTNIGVDVVALFPLNIPKVPQLSAFAKGGMERVTTDVTTSTNFGGATTSLTVSTSEFKLAIGGGVQYDVNKNFSARAGFGVMGARNDLYFAGVYYF